MGIAKDALAFSLPLLHTRRLAKHHAFLENSKRVSPDLVLPPPILLWRTRLEVTSRVISHKLAKRNSKSTLFHLSFSLLRSPRPLGLDPHHEQILSPSKKHSSTNRQQLPRLPSFRPLNTDIPSPKAYKPPPWLLPPVLNTTALQPSQLSLVRAPWDIPPWSSSVLLPGYSPTRRLIVGLPEWLLPPVPPDSKSLLSPLLFLLSVPWIVPPWQLKFLSFPPTRLFPSTITNSAYSILTLFLRLCPWMIPPWL